ncbi:MULTISPECIES: YqkE family protein [Paenibacillus]|uniref:YqkE family protein n=1 Tax=Paenibacillus TaxID=44249 RepID=UPI0020415EED|nr:YqkE family protein [Paenibacillus camelliae]MCM3632987.1 YqkE family protein [Paenibacillus camelliae]
MGKKQKKMSQQRTKAARPASQDTVASGASLKELLNADTLAKLKAQSEAMEQNEKQRREEEAARKAEAERAERKRLENDFNYLLENSDPNWSKYK